MGSDKMQTIYLDNAATTFPKPDIVYDEMDYVNRNMCVNTGRGSYSLAREATKIIDETKKAIAEMTKIGDASKVVFTPSVTIAINEIFNGIKWSEGDIVFISPFEHNSVARTLEAITIHFGIKVMLMPLDDENQIDLDGLKYELAKNQPKCICMTHISNVTGYILPIESIIEVASKYKPIIVVDAAQSLGLLPIDLRKLSIDFLAFAGHKNLYGPLGIGGFIYNSKYILGEYITGGTGSDSLNTKMPNNIPGKYESASFNIVSIAGLNAALKWSSGINDLYSHEKELSNYLIQKLRQIASVKLYLPGNLESHIGVVSFNIKGYAASDIGMILDEDYGICVRTGYHCAPYIHKCIGSIESGGTIRIGLGYFNSKEQIDKLINAINELL